MIDAQFEAFVRRYQDMVFATAVRLLGNEADAEDVAQTVFLKAFQRFDGLRDSPAAAGWLKAVTRNACLNHLSRYRGRLRLFSELNSGNANSSEPFESSLQSAATPSAIDERELHEQIEGALRRLPDHQRVPLVLFHFEEMSYQEIADTLGISLGKAKTDIHRGREALRRLLAGVHAPR
jgi:RNA polymerase sigma-70 factor (ECF subfamily)